MITDHPGRRSSSHTKHSDTRKEVARDTFNKKGTIELMFVPTAEQLADG